MDAVFTHDAAALAAVVDPSLFSWLDGAVVVVSDGPAKGRTIMDEGGWVDGLEKGRSGCGEAKGQTAMDEGVR